MSKKIVWDQESQKTYETGVEKGVLYVKNEGAYNEGVAWNGLISVSENPSGADANPIYADNIKFLSLTSTEEFGATIQAYTYPKEFEVCDGSAELAKGITIGQQARNSFGLSYITKIGNDEKGNDYGYKVHLIYGAKAQPSQKDYQTISESPDAIQFSWEITTTPVAVANHKPTSLITIDSTKIESEKLEKILNILHGNESEEPRLPLPDEILSIYNS